jgi:hypothetical protein
VIRTWRWLYVLSLLGILCPFSVFSQIDPVRRDLIQVGFNVAMQGHPPQSGYAYYYRNQPDFFRTNLTLRLAIAPTYLDSELGISHALGPNTDVGFGAAGGGFADSYAEISQGTFRPKQSFAGYGGELSASAYHLFNPGHQIPLNGVLRGIVHYSTFDRNSDTSPDFLVPDDLITYKVRSGLRWGGREPTLFPSLAMELSIWYQGEFRSDDQAYGYQSPVPGAPRDRSIEAHSHLFWFEGYLAYLMPETKQSFAVNLTAGTSVDADRFSAYRLGALLPLVSEFPLSLPGYYYQEISARQFVLLSANYLFPLDNKQHWNIDLNAATAFVDYLPGLEQPGHWHSGVGAGVLFKSSSWKVMLAYGYGVDAIRSEGRGAHSIGLLMQLDLSAAKESLFNPAQPGLWRGLQQVFGLFGS